MDQRKNKAPKDQFPYPAKRPTMENRLEQNGVSGHTDTPENENSKPELFERWFFRGLGWFSGSMLVLGRVKYN